MLLELRNVKKHFTVKTGGWRSSRRVVRAVDGVDLAMTEGESLGLVGESGSGKTTVGRLILRLYDPDDGVIMFDGQPLTALRPKEMRARRRDLQMVFQDPYSSLDPRYSVRRILAEAMELAPQGRNAKEDLQRMERVLADVGLPAPALIRYPHEFSGGERQRIAIARALIMRPKLLILDEAVSALDVLVQQQLLQLLDELRKKYKLTYLFISHNLRVVRRVCPRVAVMYGGRVVESGSQQQIMDDPRHPYTQALLAAAVNYRAAPEQDWLEGMATARLMDTGDGHYVLQ